MNLLYRADQEQSLNVMWRAYLAATPCNSAKNLSKNAATVGHAFLNARYYDSNRGQFLSEDPVHLAVGDAQQIKQLTGQDVQSYLADPQQLNSYAYARGNPLRYSDPQGLWFKELVTGKQSWSSFNDEFNRASMQLSQDSPTWKFAMDHPYTTSALVGLLAAPAAASGADALLAFRAAAFPGVGTAYAAKETIAGLVYTSLTLGTIYGATPSTVKTLSQANASNPSAYLGTVVSLTINIGPTIISGYIGSISDTIQFVSMLNDGLSQMIAASQNSSSASRATPQNTNANSSASTKTKTSK